MMNREIWNKEIKKQFRVLKNPFALIFFIIMVLYALSFIIPTLWMLLTTFKDRLEFRFNLFGFPENFTLENYYNVFDKLYVQLTSSSVGIIKVYTPELMFNGIVFSVLTTGMSLIVQLLVSYGCAKYKSLAGKIIYGFVIVTMILPIVGSLPASLLIRKRLGMYNNLIGTVIAQSGWGGATFLILYGAFKSIPNDFKEAAEIEGANQFHIFVFIMIPMIITTIFALFILGFIGSWNDYMTPMIYLPSMPTIAYGLFQFRYSSDSLVSAIPTQITASLVVMIPIFIIFMLFKDKIMGNIMLGGLKG